jgi:hypothetical protein
MRVERGRSEGGTLRLRERGKDEGRERNLSRNKVTDIEGRKERVTKEQVRGVRRIGCNQREGDRGGRRGYETIELDLDLDKENLSACVNVVKRWQSGLARQFS